MKKYILTPESIVDELAQFIRQADGNNKMGAGSLAEKICERFRVDVPAVQGEPVAAQQRFRHPQKTSPDWSVWQPASISLDRPSWEIDSQGYEVEYRLLYDAPQPAEQKPAPDVEGLVTLLEHARCNTCDGSGAVYDGHGQALNCQWCHDRSTALATHRKGGEL